MLPLGRRSLRADLQREIARRAASGPESGQERGLSNLPTTLLYLSSASDCGKRSSGGRALRVVRIRPRPRLVCLVTLRLLLLGEGKLTWDRGRLGRRRRRLRTPAEQLVDPGAN